MRLFGVALALANSKDGFLLIDEAENGIHHSIQRDFWTMILKAAHQNNVQVLATTHSWDCVAGFAMAATEIEEVDGASSASIATATASGLWSTQRTTSESQPSTALRSASL